MPLGRGKYTVGTLSSKVDGDWGARLRKVLTRCSASGEVVTTHALMTPSQMERFRGELHFWCRICRASHPRAWGEIWLEGSEPAQGAEAHAHGQARPEHQQSAKNKDPIPAYNAAPKLP